MRPYHVSLCMAAMIGSTLTAASQTVHKAYMVPAGTAGNQAFNGSLGMDFDVANRIEVTRLGCFDDNSDGIWLPISVRLYNRDTQEVLASADFVPGDDGTLEGGSRFRNLGTVLTLPTGFRGTIVAEGYGAGERNGNRNPAPWTTDTGSGSIAFVGGGRYNFPVIPGAFPEGIDGGPATRYAAGTFEFRTLPPEKPGAPAATAVPGNGRVTLTWNAVTQPLPAARYRIVRSTEPGGTFSQIAEVSETSYTDATALNGTLYCYKIIGVGAGGQVGLDSPVVCARPVDLGTNRQVAYDTPWGVAGTQDFNGAVGMDFDVTNPVIVSRLGCFDDNSDGLYAEISVRLYNRDTQEVVASFVFSPDDPGTPEREDGEPIGGMRFRTLTAPVTLPIGFRGCIVAEGYSGIERLCNSFGLLPNIRWTTNGGNGSLVFTGTSRFNFPVVPGAFPETPDAIPAQYAGGTFLFETTPPVVPGTPVVTARGENHAVTLTWPAVTLPLPATSYRILTGATPEGPFTPVGETNATTFRVTGLANLVEQCFIVRAVAAGGQVSLDSNYVCAVPQARTPGIAYLVPAGLVGNQSFGGALGMEFNVEQPVIITQLGAFDSAGDGMQQTVTVRLFERRTGTALATAAFEPGNDGTLVDGSRFLRLAEPLRLPAGFEGMIVASGYGDLEPNGNAGSTNLGLSTFGGACLRFVGRSLYGLNPDLMADSQDNGPANRYAAGTFAFEPDLPPSGLAIATAPDGKVTITWTDASGVLERTSNLGLGPWEFLPSAVSGYTIPANQPQEFFRLTR